MKACFPIVGEKEYKNSTLRTEQRQWVFTKLRVESAFISFVSFSFNSPHVSVPTRTSIRAIGEIRVQKKYSCHLLNYLPSVCGPSANLVFKKNSCSKSVWSVRSVCQMNIRVIRIIRVQNQWAPRREQDPCDPCALNIVRSACKNYSLNSFYSCSKNLVFKIRVIGEIRVPNEYSWHSDYSCSKISCKHLGNIFKSGELNQRSVSSILEHTASDGKVYRTLITNNFFPKKHLSV